MVMKKSYLQQYYQILWMVYYLILKLTLSKSAAKVKPMTSVKINEKNEIKEKIILLTLFLLLISTLAVFLAF